MWPICLLESLYLLEWCSSWKSQSLLRELLLRKKKRQFLEKAKLRRKWRMPTTEPYEVFSKYGMTPPDEIFFDEKIHRFSANGKPRDKAGWYTGKETGELRVLV